MDLKIEKANAMMRYRRLQKMATLFRFFEIFVVLIALSRFSSLLPVTFVLSGDYLRQLLVATLSPRFVFVVGNVIVAILYLKSGQKSTQSDAESKICVDLCNEYIGSKGINPEIRRKQSKICVDQQKIGNRKSHPEIQRENQKKQSKICVDLSDEHIENRKSEIRKEGGENQRKQIVISEKDNRSIVANTTSSKVKKIRRSASENRIADNCPKVKHGLRRSATEAHRKSWSSGEKPSIYAEDEMSGEEFRRTVEAFIARQQRILREEEEIGAIVAV